MGPALLKVWLGFVIGGRIPHNPLCCSGTTRGPGSEQWLLKLSVRHCGEWGRATVSCSLYSRVGTPVLLSASAGTRNHQILAFVGGVGSLRILLLSDGYPLVTS
jgi:hypothetical protein